MMGSDMGDDFREFRKDKQKRHLLNYSKNLDILCKECSGMFIIKNTVCLFRNLSKLPVDFYPHTGRWKVKNKMYKGGAKAFLNWYNKQGGI